MDVPIPVLSTTFFISGIFSRLWAFRLNAVGVRLQVVPRLELWSLQLPTFFNHGDTENTEVHRDRVRLN